jgi:hypothetical protein
VMGVIIVNLEGVPIYSSLSAEETTNWAAHLSQVGGERDCASFLVLGLTVVIYIVPLSRSSLQRQEE